MTTSGQQGAGQGRALSGCLIAVLIGGVGFVLAALGLLPRTKEALPFGLLLLGAGVVLGALAARQFRAGATGAALQSGGVVPVGPPRSSACPRCGAPARLSLSDPSSATCLFCGESFALPRPLVEQLTAAAARLREQSEAERQIGGSVARLAALQRGWLRTHVGIASLLTLTALLAAAYGWLWRLEDSHWHGWFVGGAAAAAQTIFLAALGAWLVPTLTKRLLGRWTALPLFPGGQALACRVCGAELPSALSAVLRCRHCAADNLAGAHVLAQIAEGSREARHLSIEVGARRKLGEERLAFAIIAFPALTLLAWFATGALADGVFIAIGHDIQVAADPDARFEVVRVQSGGGHRVCLAWPRDAGERVHLTFGLDQEAELSRSALDAARVRAPVAPRWLVGHRIEGGGRVLEVDRELYQLGAHTARLEGGLSKYLPGIVRDGELVCLAAEDTPPGEGASVSPGPR